jgi:hypothetical protein
MAKSERGIDTIFPSVTSRQRLCIHPRPRLTTIQLMNFLFVSSTEFPVLDFGCRTVGEDGD